MAYSEDVLNTWDTNVHRKMRFFPLENPDGSVVPNAYILEAEDYNLQYDSNDIVGIIRNVTPATAGAELGLENRDVYPFSDRLIFNRIKNPSVRITAISVVRSRTDIAIVLPATKSVVITTASEMLPSSRLRLPNIETNELWKARSVSVFVSYGEFANF